MDRTWRTEPSLRPDLAHPYARLLMRQGWDWPAAASLLRYALNEIPDPDVEADLIHVLHRSGPAAAAQNQLATALRRYVARPGSRLAHEARALLGEGAADPQAFPEDFRVDGRARLAAGRIRGWVRVGWDPHVRPNVTVRDEAGRSRRAQIVGRLPRGRWEFGLDVKAFGPIHTSFDVTVNLPDGSSVPLPDSPLFAERAVPRDRSKARRLRPTGSGRRPVDVIIPVYRDHERTLTCIRAVCDTALPLAANVIVVDDASPEPDLSADLDALGQAGEIQLLRNARNLGFAASVNRAMALHPDHDVVLVNSDVVVFENWLDRLRGAAYSAPDIGTATPLADDDSIVGYAAGDEVAAAGDLDALCAQVHAGRTVDLPVGVGFCQYIRRDCWQEAGPFDVRLFGRGYGEEADFCMRARRQGWRHVLAADVFVHHAGSKSFGTRRAALLERSARLLNLRHPGYDAAVARYLTRNPLQPVRRSLDSARLRAANARFVLLLTLALPGGVDRAIAQRSRQIRAEGKVPLVLQPVRLDDMSQCRLRCDSAGLQHLQFSIPRELGALRELLGSLALEAIELHHTLGLHPRLVEMVRRLGPPVDAHIHDYAWVCPRVTLMDGSRQYCGEPAVTVCEKCVRQNGSNIPETISVRALRQRSRRWLGEARRVVAPSEDTAKRLGRYLPGVPIEVVPHEVFTPRGRAPLLRPGKAVRVAVLGAIGHHKGFKVLLQCARDAARRRLPLEFVVIGYTENDARLMRTSRVFVTGQYRDDELPYLLGREAPHVVFLPSVWPETWCYTLSHAIASGLPVAAFDIGAIGERLRAEQLGTLFPLGLPPREINDRLIRLGRDTLGTGNSRMSSPPPAAVAKVRSPASM